MHQSLAQQLLGELSRGVTELPEDAARGDLAGHALIHQRLVSRHVILEILDTLRVREERLDAPQLQLKDEILQLDGVLAQRQFQEHGLAVVAQRGRPPVSNALHQVRADVHFRTGQQIQQDVFRRQQFSEPFHMGQYRVEVVLVKAFLAMRRGDQDLDAILLRHPCEGHRLLVGLHTVVHTRQDVRMQIDHGVDPSVLDSGPSGRLSRRSRPSWGEPSS